MCPRSLEQQPGHQLRRRLHLGGALHESHGGGPVPGQFGAIPAAGQVLLDRSSGVRPQRAVNVVADENFQFRARHTSTFCLRKTRANSARPRFSLRFHGAFRDAQDAGDLPVLQILQVAQDHGLAQLGRQLLQSPLQNLASLAACHHALGPGRRRDRFLDAGKLLFNRIRQTLLAGAPVIIDQQITRQARQPGRKGAFGGPERFQRPVDAQEHLLGEILRLAVLPRKSIAKPVDTAGVGSDQILPSGFVAAQTPVHQAVIEVQTLFYPISAAAVRSFWERSA